MMNINLYIPSVLTWKEKSLKLRMTTDYPEHGKVVISFSIYDED